MKPFVAPRFDTYRRGGTRPAFWNDLIMKTLILAGAVILGAAPALAQVGTLPNQPRTTGTVIQNETNSTGNDRNVVISRGATGADTIETDSAAGGNAGRPEQAIPNSSGGGR